MSLSGIEASGDLRAPLAESCGFLPATSDADWMRRLVANPARGSGLVCELAIH
jgi:hypothetical protein